MVNIRQNLVDSNKYDIKCPHEMNAEFIVVHNTANDASANNEIEYMKNNNNKVSFHYAVDDVEIVQGILENRNAWHAGDGNGDGNRKGIAIEICYSKSGGEKFDKAEENAAEFIASKLKEKGWGIDKVKKHADFYPAKGCPHRTISEGWQRFLDMVNSYLQDKPTNNENIENGSDEPVRKYVNGSTSENVYADTECTIKIGSLNPRETCDCFGTFNDRAMVRYIVTGTNNYKMGFCKWLGGVK